jgi:hypothetical protein
MSRQTKTLLLYVALLVLSHGFAFVVFYSDVISYGTSLHYLLGLLALSIVPLVFSFRIHTWSQFGLYLLVTVVLWHVFLIFDDWMVGRLSDPLWLKDKEGTWGVELLGRSIMPVALISVGAMMGRWKGTPRLP